MSISVLTVLDHHVDTDLGVDFNPISILSKSLSRFRVRFLISVFHFHLVLESRTSDLHFEHRFEISVSNVGFQCRFRTSISNVRLRMSISNLDINVNLMSISQCQHQSSKSRSQSRYQPRLLCCVFALCFRCFGDFLSSIVSYRYLHIVAVLMFVTFMLLVAIVYLNLLVAIMTSGYTEVRKEGNDGRIEIHVCLTRNHSSAIVPMLSYIHRGVKGLFCFRCTCVRSVFFFRLCFVCVCACFVWLLLLLLCLFFSTARVPIMTRGCAEVKRKLELAATGTAKSLKTRTYPYIV